MRQPIKTGNSLEFEQLIGSFSLISRSPGAGIPIIPSGSGEVIDGVP